MAGLVPGVLLTVVHLYGSLNKIVHEYVFTVTMFKCTYMHGYIVHKLIHH